MAKCGGVCKVSTLPLDLSSFASIEKFAANFEAEHGKLDILMNNAGVMALPTKELTQDGLEKQMGINHFGHFLLTNLLLGPLLAAGRSGGDARIINLSSQAHLLALRGVKFRAASASEVLRRNLLVYGLGGFIIPFIGIKLIDLVITAMGVK